MRKTDEIGCVDDSSAERTVQRVKEIRKLLDYLRQVLELEVSRFRTSPMMVSMASLLKGSVLLLGSCLCFCGMTPSRD